VNKKSYVVFQSCGGSHIVKDVDEYSVDGGTVHFYSDKTRIAYFTGISAVLVQPALEPVPGNVEACRSPKVELSSPAFVGEAMLSGTVVINVYCDGNVPAKVVADTVASAINTVHGVV
jgi:hypothetical protein